MNKQVENKNNFIKELINETRKDLIKVIEGNIKCDIVKAITLNAVDSGYSDKTYREFLKATVNSYPINEGWFHDSYLYKEVVDEIIKEVSLRYIEDYVKLCLNYGEHSDFLLDNLTTALNPETIYTETLNEFCLDIFENEGIKIIQTELDLYKSNPKVEVFYTDYINMVVGYTIERSQYYLLSTQDSELECPNINEYITPIFDLDED